jgi:ABC-type glycerol-3-phosphate transport system substrate-binding protein
VRVWLVAWLAIIACADSACADGGTPAPRGERLRLWHTFSPDETRALNEALAALPSATVVEPTLLPFSRAQRILAEALGGATDCPDLVRIDATWLPGLVDAELLAAAPTDALGDESAWLAEALELTSYRDTVWGLPQSVDGLALLANQSRIDAAHVAWPPRTVNELVATAHRLTADDAYGLSVRVDGYWFVAFLRGWGGDVLDPQSGALGVDSAVAQTALSRFADLFSADGVAPPPPPAGDEAPAEQRRFRAGKVAIVVDGPWAIAALRGKDPAPLTVAPFPRDPGGRGAAPRGGHLFVVPRCARRADAAWQLARALAAPRLQADWSRRLGLIPTTQAGLADADPIARDFRAALASTRPLPRHPTTTELFDDLSPAVAAVVAGDATAAEALAGVARAWTRIRDRPPRRARVGGAAP